MRRRTARVQASIRQLVGQVLPAPDWANASGDLGRCPTETRTVQGHMARRAADESTREPGRGVGTHSLDEGRGLRASPFQGKKSTHQGVLAAA